MKTRLIEFKCSNGRWAAFCVDMVQSIEEQESGETLIVTRGGDFTVPMVFGDVVDKIYPRESKDA
jgi:hypothetical protein